MDAQQVEALITAVEKRQSLYDKTSPDYSNRNYLNAEWQKIAEEVGCNDTEARKRWKKLREYFRKNHREMTTCKSGSAGSKKRKWYLYDRLQFVLPYINDRNTTTTNVTSISSDEEIMDNDDNISRASSSSFTIFSSRDAPTPTHLPPDSNTDNQDLLNVPSTSDSHSHEKSRRCRPKLFPQNRNGKSDFESEMLKAAQRLGERKVVQQEIDEDELFLRSLVPKMKMLSTLDNMECQGEIHRIVFKYMRKNADAAQQKEDRRVHRSPPIARNPYSSSAVQRMIPSPQTTTCNIKPEHCPDDSQEDLSYTTSQYSQY